MAAIGTKEGIIDAIREKVGSAITDSVLQTSDRTETKSVSEILLSKLFATVLEAAERPTALDTRDEYKALAGTRFDFRTRLVNSVEQLQVKINKAKGYGIIVQNNISSP